MKNNPKCNSGYWLYSIRVLNDKKQEFMEKMKEANIMTSQVHNRNDINSCVKEFEEILPNIDILEKELVCIPVGWWLEEKDIEHIVKSILEIINYIYIYVFLCLYNLSSTIFSVFLISGKLQNLAIIVNTSLL
mgnify:CR=1 FL=1